VDDRVAIDIVDTGHDALAELLLGCHPNVTQDRAGKEEALDEIEPEAVDKREGEREAAARSSGEPASGRGAGRIGGTDQGMNLPGEQINPSQQAERTMPFVLMIARESRVDAGLGRQIGPGRCHWGLRFKLIAAFGNDSSSAINSNSSASAAWSNSRNLARFASSSSSRVKPAALSS